MVSAVITIFVALAQVVVVVLAVSVVFLLEALAIVRFMVAFVVNCFDHVYPQSTFD